MGRLPFMDLNVQRRFDEIETTVFRKTTYTDRYLQFDSHHPHLRFSKLLILMKTVSFLFPFWNNGLENAHQGIRYKNAD